MMLSTVQKQRTCKYNQVVVIDFETAQLAADSSALTEEMRETECMFDIGAAAMCM